MQEIKGVLKKIWLSDREISIYISCLQYGKVTAATLARMTNIPRASIYDHASKLIKKWCITTGSDNKKTYYSAVDPHDMYVFLNEEKNAVIEKVDLFKEAIPALQQMKQFTGIVPQIQYYEGKESLELFFHKIAHASYSYSIFSLDDLLKHIYFDIDEIYEKLSNPSIKGAKRIMAYSDRAKEYIKKQKNKNIERKLLPPWYTMAAEITLFDGVLLQMSFGDNPSILEMKHPIYYQAQKTLFDYIWKSLK